ncbi:MerR family DNA-binding transcriptional regulator [Pseudomonas sp. MOB-449]|nr:MerR family DNA-binding transcriptional regulator [Pseudomonas sp. MOB-449]
MQIETQVSRSGASTRALRHYEAKGLIESTRLGNSYRDHASSTLQRVLWDRELIECGLSTRQIHEP